MKNFKSVSNGELLNQTKSLVAEERRVGLEILHRLREIERRRLHLELGYSSLFTFCVEELKYSESAAYRRIQAMRVLVEIPEIEPQIQEGKLSISTLSQVQSFCQAQKKENAIQIGLEEKKEILKSVENKSKRETEKILVSHFPQPLSPPDQARVLTENQTELRLVINERLMKKLEQIRNLRSHKNFSPSYAELLEDMADLVLKQLLPPVKEAPQKETKAVTPKTKAVIRTQNPIQCSFVSKNGHQCQETRALQIDHRIPKALGGSNLPQNLRLLCKSHNLHEALRVLGRAKMTPYLR
jgi:hypothetical protein